MSEFSWNKKKEDLTPIDQGSYLLYSLLLWTVEIVLVIFLPPEGWSVLVKLFPFVIGYGLTKRRLIDTDLSYKWRYAYFVGGMGIFLTVFLYFKKSKNIELSSKEEDNKFLEKLNETTDFRIKRWKESRVLEENRQSQISQDLEVNETTEDTKELEIESKIELKDVTKHKIKDKSFTIILIILLSFLICLIGYSFFDKMNGQGTRTYDNGDKYVGEWLDGKSNGQGTYTYANGNKYVGQMKENKQDGLGSFTYVNGDKYVGQMKENKQDGQGTMTYADGTKYVGEWKNGNEDGKGTFTTNETKYVGEHKNGVMHGQGTMSSSDGTKYVGVWKDGEMHGVGSYTSADGTKYLGEWKDSQMHGQGTMSSSDFKYVGEWKDNQLHGQGTMINFYGSKYVGEFKDDEYHGQGTMTYSNGTVVKGLWGNGEFLGEEDAKKVIKAQYYLELAGDRMKVDGSGRFDMSKEDWNYVVENLSKSLDLDADLLMVYLFRGNAYYYMGKYRKSMKDYKKITRIPKYKFESTDELSLLPMAYIGLGNAKLKLKLNYCKEYKKACDLGDCLEYNRLCK